MKISRDKRERIFLIFFLGIVLPSLLLGYLAFRGIKNDQALLEKDRLDEQRRMAGLITATINERIAAVEQDYAKTLSSSRNISQPALILSLEKFKLDHPFVEEIFVCQNFKTVRFPSTKLLFSSPGIAPPLPVKSLSSSLSEKVLAGQHLEFEDKKYREAIATYRQSLDQATDPQIRGELLSAVARAQKKSALYREAIQSYALIAQDFSRVRSAGGIPLGLAARMEVAALYWAVHNATNSLKISLDLYKTLLRGEWTLEEAQYEFFVQNIRNIILEVFSTAQPDPQLQSYKGTFSALEAEEKGLRSITERLLPFLKSAAPDLETKIAGNSSPRSNSFKRLTLELGKQSYLVSLGRPEMASGREVEDEWGLLFSVDYLKEVLLPQVMKQHVTSEDAAWIVRGKDSQILLASEQSPTRVVTVRADFADNFPDWSLEFYQPTPRLLRTFLGARQGIYLYMFLLIAAFLIFGLILTVRTVSHELELARMKSDFVSTVSHEFKSPLTSIQQLAEMLQAGRIPSEERRQQYYEVLLEQSQRLSLLTDNILSLARMEEGRKEFDFEILDIRVLLSEVASNAQDRVRHEGFIIELNMADSLPEVRADGTALAQAVTNLLDNAIKYSGEARKIVISATARDQNLVIAVKDFGIGIKKEEIHKVFERFYRGGDELTRSVKGTGLGLTLVKEIVKAHRGKVYVESAPGHGSTFSILLPLPKTEAD